jgi:hypothetical protein
VKALNFRQRLRLFLRVRALLARLWWGNSLSTKFDSSLFVDVTNALGLGKAAKPLVASAIALSETFSTETASIVRNEYRYFGFDSFKMEFPALIR